METINASKLALGTVQFGLDYGISNSSGRTQTGEVAQILAFAKQKGLSTIDTAYAYGESEQVLGEQDLNDWNIISKYPPPGNLPIKESFAESLSRLKVDKLYGYLAHNATILLDNPKLWKNLQELKAEGKIKKIGYSLYTPQELEILLRMDMIPDMIQIPYNILDTRFESKFEYLKSIDVEIHTRSAFLQGLFFMKPETLPEFFNPVKSFLHQLEAAFPETATRAAALLQYPLRNKYIDKVVIGVNNIAQLEANIKALNEEYSITEPNGKPMPSNILNPSQWPK